MNQPTTTLRIAILCLQSSDSLRSYLVEKVLQHQLNTKSVHAIVYRMTIFPHEDVLLVRALAILRAMNFNFGARGTVKFDRASFDRAHVIIALDNGQMGIAVSRFPEFTSKTFLLNTLSPDRPIPCPAKEEEIEPAIGAIDQHVRKAINWITSIGAGQVIAVSEGD